MRPARNIEQMSDETIETEIRVASSLLNVTHLALQSGTFLDGEELAAVSTTIYEAHSRLAELVELLSDGCESDHKFLKIVDRYGDAHRAHVAAVEAGDDDEHGKRYQDYSRAVDDLISFRCRTIDVLRHKARYILESDDLLDWLTRSTNGAVLRSFLSSMADDGVSPSAEEMRGR